MTIQELLEQKTKERINITQAELEEQSQHLEKRIFSDLHRILESQVELYSNEPTLIMKLKNVKDIPIEGKYENISQLVTQQAITESYLGNAVVMVPACTCSYNTQDLFEVISNYDLFKEKIQEYQQKVDETKEFLGNQAEFDENEIIFNDSDIKELVRGERTFGYMKELVNRVSLLEDCDELIYFADGTEEEKMMKGINENHEDTYRNSSSPICQADGLIVKAIKEQFGIDKISVVTTSHNLNSNVKEGNYDQIKILTI